MNTMIAPLVSNNSPYMQLNHQPSQELTELTLSRFEEHIDQIFFKSQVSLAETCEDDSPKNCCSGTDSFEVDSLSIKQFWEDNLVKEEDNCTCHTFLMEGSCMKGKDCDWIHYNSSNQTSRSRKSLLWIIQEVPEMLLVPRKRMVSFLA